MNARLSRATLRVLAPAEWVQARACLHRSIYLPGLAVLLVWLPVFIWACVTGLDLVAVLALAVVAGGVPLLWVWAWLRARTSFMLLTDQRLIAVRGPYPRRVVALPIGVIDTVHVRRARLGSAATLYASPFLDADAPVIEMHDLADARAFAAAIRGATAPRGV